MTFQDVFPGDYKVYVQSMGAFFDKNPRSDTFGEVLVDYLSEMYNISHLVMDNPDLTSERKKVVDYKKLNAMFEIVSEQPEQKRVVIKIK